MSTRQNSTYMPKWLLLQTPRHEQFPAAPACIADNTRRSQYIPLYNLYYIDIVYLPLNIKRIKNKSIHRLGD